MGKRIGFLTRAVVCLAGGVFFSLLSVLSGCVPSTSQIINMRKETWGWKAKENCQTVLKCIQGESGPSQHAKKAAWRVEALRTLHHIDRKFGYASVEPELHRSLLDATTGEYQRPGSAGQRDLVRAWAIRLLGGTTPRPPTSYFVEVLTENSPDNDPDYVVSLAALGVLYPDMDALADDPVLRRKVLYWLAGAAGDLDRRRVNSGRREELLDAVKCFQQRLKSYPAVVDLLRTGASGNGIHALLEILTWNYQQLKVGAHRSSTGRGPELLAENTGQLLAVAWHDDSGVRSRSRLILAEFAPEALFDAVVKRVAGEGPAAPEDYRQLAALMVKFNNADYRLRRAKAHAALRRAHPNILLSQREVVYGKLLAHYPSDLMDSLRAANGAALKESERSGLQHLRYLEHVRGALASSDKAIDRKIDPLVAAFMRHGSLAVRKQVAASLARRDPVLLARSCAAAITSISRDSAVSAKYLTDVYMGVLADIESQNRMKDLKQAMGDREPYELLSCAAARPEYSIRAGIAGFLCGRNCDLLVDMLSRNLKRTSDQKAPSDIRDWSLLGDVVQKYHKKLTKQSLAAAWAVLIGGLSSSDSERAILCARYLLELGHDPENIAGASVGARVLADMARAKAKAAKKPDPRRSADNAK